MKKWTKRISATVLALMMSISVTAIDGFAFSKANSDSDVVLYEVTGSLISDDLKECVQNMGVAVTETSRVQVTSVVSSTGGNVGNALIITNENGTTATKDVLLLADDDGLVSIETSDAGGISLQSSSSAEYPPESWDGRYVIKATAQYDSYTGASYATYYRPKKVSFSYKKYQTCTVNSITVKYQVGGVKCAYPGYDVISTDEVYTITASKTNPVASTTYTSSTAAYPSNRVIRATGGPLAGCIIQFNSKVDGVSDTYSVIIG